MVKKVSSGGIPFARKEAYEYENVKYQADIKDGDIVTILTSGVVEDNKWGTKSHYFNIKTRNGDKKVGFNQTCINILVDAFGKNSEDWVNRNVNVILHKTVVSGRKAIIAYFVVNGWSIDEYGELVQLGEKKNKDSQETIDYPENEVNPEDSPF